MKTFFLQKVKPNKKFSYVQFFKETTIYSKILEIFQSVYQFRAIPQSYRFIPLKTDTLLKHWCIFKGYHV